MIFSLQNKVTVVTGGGSGIGKAIAQQFALQGSEVWILDKDESSANQTANEIIAHGGKATGIASDVTNQSKVLFSFENIFRKSNRIDILVNSAGIAHIGGLEKTSEAEFEKIFSVNVKGTYNTMFAVVPGMKKQQKGVILNLASVAASAGISDRFAYSMSKGAVVSMTLSVARDYVKEGIRCNCISPARVHTPFVDGFIKANYPGKEKETFEKLAGMQPIGRMGTPEEVAYLALYLCSDEASFVTGCDYPIDGGFLNLNS